MICVTDCVDVKCLAAPGEAAATANVIIGTLEISEDYTVYVYNETTNNTYAVDYTSAIDGLLTISLLDYGLVWNPHGVYYLWVTLQDANMTDQEIIDIGGTDYTCLILTFERTFVNGLVSCPTSQTIEIG